MLSRQDSPDGLVAFSRLMVDSPVIAVQECGIRPPQGVEISGLDVAAMGAYAIHISC